MYKAQRFVSCAGIVVPRVPQISRPTNSLGPQYVNTQES
ncbi:hypothetical protein FQN60_004661 [Etheostoma spectabile]|uniref:Uncharacterized protein n=1 Tax=Etheostoma spectabile TaxID=54343 RepID=A0A5J5DK96_9PERO|nr:hypothetical protein FQN60_004661 [Etheostoma spectabile]